MIISGKSSLLFYRGALPDEDMLRRATAQEITYIYDKYQDVIAIVCQEGLYHEVLEEEYMPEGSEVLGGIRYDHGKVINSKKFIELDGPAVLERYFHDAFFLNDSAAKD